MLLVATGICRSTVDLSGKKRTVYALTLVELREKEKQIERDLQDGIVSAHILRHTACTRLAETGLEPKVLQYIMGHANVAVTLDVYTHLDYAQIQEKMEAVQENMKIG